jgi:hypothetical protein
MENLLPTITQISHAMDKALAYQRDIDRRTSLGGRPPDAPRLSTALSGA